jgi:hypothetical protein
MQQPGFDMKRFGATKKYLGQLTCICIMKNEIKEVPQINLISYQLCKFILTIIVQIFGILDPGSIPFCI